MYGIFPYIWIILTLNVGKHTIYTWIIWVISQSTTSISDFSWHSKWICLSRWGIRRCGAFNPQGETMFVEGHLPRRHDIHLNASSHNRVNHWPYGSMYGIYTYIWLIFMVNVGKYTIPYMDPMGNRFSKKKDKSSLATFSPLILGKVAFDSSATRGKKNRKRKAKGSLPSCLFNKGNAHKGVSENNGTPKSSILIGFSIINHPFGVPPFSETPINFPRIEGRTRQRQCHVFVSRMPGCIIFLWLQMKLRVLGRVPLNFQYDI